MPQNQMDAEIEYDDLMRRLERIEAQVRHGAQCAARDHDAILNTGSAVENLDATMNHLTNGLAQNVLRPINNLTKLFENQQAVLTRHEALLERHERGLVDLHTTALEIRDYVVKLASPIQPTGYINAMESSPWTLFARPTKKFEAGFPYLTS